MNDYQIFKEEEGYVSEYGVSLVVFSQVPGTECYSRKILLNKCHLYIINYCKSDDNIHGALLFTCLPALSWDKG
jgi:hypothetical protein